MTHFNSNLLLLLLVFFFFSGSSMAAGALPECTEDNQNAFKNREDNKNTLQTTGDKKNSLQRSEVNRKEPENTGGNENRLKSPEENQNAQESPEGNEELESTEVKIIFTPKQKTILSTAIPAKVIKIGINLGESVKKDDPLILLDDFDTRALLAKASSTFTNAEMKLQVIQKLFDQGEESLINFNDAKNNVNVTAADFQLTQKHVDEMVIRSPFDGQISNIVIHEFEFAKIGEPLIEVVNNDVIIGKMLLPAAFSSKITFGNSISIYVPFIDKNVSGKIIGIGPVIEPTSATVKVEVEIDNSERLLIPGLFGIAAFTHPIKRSL